MHPTGAMTVLLACALIGSAQARHPDQEGLADAIRLGLDFVVQGAEEPPEESAVQRYGAVEEVRLRARRERIRAEIEQLGEHDWAGTYSCGDGLGMNVSLEIAPKAGAVYTWYGCLGLYDLNHGDVTEVSDGRVRLDLVIDPALNNHWFQTALPRRYMSDEWILVRWGKERYMVPSSQMIPFCNDVSRGGWGGEFPRRGAGLGIGSKRFDAPPEGLPEVPAEYRPFLLAEPLAGSILAVEEPRSIGTFAGGETMFLARAQVDIGLERGLLPGMELFVTEPGGRGRGEVVAVDPQRATVEYRFAIYEEERDVPRPHWAVSTRPRPR
jgi:hypothetical protein